MKVVRQLVCKHKWVCDKVKHINGGISTPTYIIEWHHCAVCGKQRKLKKIMEY